MNTGPVLSTLHSVRKKEKLMGLITWIFKSLMFEFDRKDRRDYYRDEYLKSDAWRRERFVVLRRDNWRCKYCGGRATQVHHLRYAKRNIGKEPIE